MTSKYGIPRPPKIVRPSWEITVSDSDGIAPMWLAKKEMLKNKVARITAIQIRVIPALRLRGSLKAVMPFDMASIPVRAAVPLENAWRRRKGVITEITL